MPSASKKDKGKNWNAGLTEAEKKWKEERKKQGGGYDNSLPEIDDGVYNCRLTAARCTASDKGRFLAFNYVVEGGTFEGTKLSTMENLNQEVGMSIARGRLQAMNVNTEELSLSDFPEMCKALTEAQPLLQVKVVNETYKDKKTGEEKPTLRIYVNGVVDAPGKTAKKPATKKAPVKKKSR